MLDFNKEKYCYGCEACFNICPVDAIAMIEMKDGFYIPEIDKRKCIKCMACDRVCPALQDPKNKKFQKACFAAYNKEEVTRGESSSGGVITSIARKIISIDGVVYGAKYDENFKVIHTRIDNFEDLQKIRGSKYAQSRINDNFRNIRKDIKNGKKVLFIGTPCEVKGLLNFIGKKEDNLITCSVFCHGVPSPKVFSLYIDTLENAHNSKVKNYNFRDKKESWQNYHVNVEFENGDIFRESVHKNIYMKGFLKDLYLRGSCYNCSYKGEDIPGDFIIGDFWGIDNFYKDFNDDKGISAVIVNSKVASKIWDDIKHQLTVIAVNYDEIVKYNPSFVKPALEHKDREKFFLNLTKDNLKREIHRYTKDKFIIRVKRKFKRILG